MIFVYTDTDVKISPFEDTNVAYITVHKPYEHDGERYSARVTWSRFAQQYAGYAYQFAQALFVAGGLADAFNLIDDMDVVRKFGQV